MTRVLVVDDDPLVRSGLKIILESTEDLQVVAEAADGREAVAAVSDFRPDVVVMDLRMPHLDGRAATAAVAALPDPPPVLILTTFDVSAELMAALEAGASGFLLKDTDPAGLIAGVRETAAGRSVLSPRHTRTLLDRYANQGFGARQAVARDRLASLTEREQDVVGGVAQGLSNAEIADELGCSVATVKSHLAHIFVRLGLDNRVLVAILGHDAGLAR